MREGRSARGAAPSRDRRWTWPLAALAAIVALGAAGPAGARAPAAPAGWPAILGSQDAARYRTIFALQADGRWAAANAVIARLHDRLLIGEVLAQRYLSRRYKTSYPELAAWLARYADEGEARAIHALAAARRPRGAPQLPAPTAAAPVGWGGARDDPAEFHPVGPSAPRHDSSAADAAKAAIGLAARRDPAHGEILLAAAERRRALTGEAADDAGAELAEGELFAGNYRAALRLAAQLHTRAYLPLAHWIAGLAAWGQGHLEEARSHFELLARLPDLSPWNMAAAMFWAARVALAAHRLDLGAYWLGEAARRKRTFYGMLACGSLGLSADVPAVVQPATSGDIARVSELPLGRQALALLQIGERARAETALRMLIGAAPPEVLAALVPLADRANLPALSLELAARLRAGRLRDEALYPVPRWRPRGGFRLDPALLLAFMRQESEFRPDNESPAGAVGLMQLMWHTARQMAATTGVALTSRAVLRDPEINLALGQAYLQHLLGRQGIAGNLVLLATAYNLGPARLARWSSADGRAADGHAVDGHAADPLFFLETMPSRETRVFVERVLVNYWIYRRRFGRPTRGLDLLAAGGWPIYAGGAPVESDYAWAR